MSLIDTCRKLKVSSGIEALRLSALAALLMASLLIAEAGHARGGGSGGSSGGASSLLSGETQFGLVFGVSQSIQDDLNNLATRANSRANVGPITTGSLNSAWELGAQFGFRVNGSMIFLLLRPTYFMETTAGTGSDGSYNYGVTGFTVFPIMRLVPLENDFMKFFLNIGLGYGRATTKIDEGSAHVEAVGDTFGTLIGMGAEFCITAVQCISFEGNYRYLLLERSLVTSTSGTFASNSVTTPVLNKELELDGTDMQIRMGGLQFLAGYIIHY